MPPQRRSREENDSDDLLRNLADIKREIKKLRSSKNEAKEEKQEVVIELPETFDFDKKIKEMQEKLEVLSNDLLEFKEFLFQHATGARPFIHNQAIMKAMLNHGSADSWKAKAPKELAGELTTVQRSLNEKKEFEAASELQGLVEIAEMAREIVMMNASASTWIKRALDDAIGTVLCLGKEKRGQAIFWACIQRQIVEKVAEQEKKPSITKPKGESSSSGMAEIPCRNCVKNGLYNQMHTVSECARRRNPCRLECAYCPHDAVTKEFPCHWRDDCPAIRRRERASSSRNGFFR